MLFVVQLNCIADMKYNAMKEIFNWADTDAWEVML